MKVILKHPNILVAMWDWVSIIMILWLIQIEVNPPQVGFTILSGLAVYVMVNKFVGIKEEDKE